MLYGMAPLISLDIETNVKLIIINTISDINGANCLLSTSSIMTGHGWNEY